MPFDPTKKTQLGNRVATAKADLGQVESTLLGGARDAAVTDAERRKVYDLLQLIGQVQDQLSAVLLQV